MPKFPSKPQKGQPALQSIYNSLVEVIDYLPSLTVVGDSKTTSVNHSAFGTTIHALPQSISINTTKKEGEQYTSGRFIQITSANEINCTLSAGNNIEITPNGVINCTLTGGGGSGGGNTYYADNFTLSTTTSGGNTFCLYDVYPLLTGRGGITVERYGDAPLYPGHALGTVITCPYYVGSGGIGIIEGAAGTNTEYIALTGDIDYNAGTGISIDPATRTINCTVEPGGGGETYYADESTIKLSSTNNTFYLYDVEPLLTGDGGIKVYNYGTDGLGRRVTGISATPYTGGDNISVDNYVISMTATIPTKTSDLTNDSHFITINDVPPGSVYQGDNVTIAASGTNNNIFYVINGVFAPLTTVVNLSTELSGHIDYVSSNIPLSTSELVNDVPFVTSGDLDAYYKVSAFNAVGDHLQYVPRLGRLNCTLSGGDWIQIDEQDRINCILENVSDLNNDVGYVTTTDLPPTRNADNSTLSCSDNTFYVLNVSSLLTGRGGTTVYNYGTGLSGQEIVGISSLNYQGGNGIQITPVEGQGGVATTYASIGLSTEFYNDLTAISTRPATGDKILSSHNGALSWETNNASSPTWTSLTPNLLAVNNSNHTLSAATQSGGGGGGIPWPNYANLENGGGNMVAMYSDYTAGDNGGWLRVSYKGSVIDDCYYVAIDGHKIGLWRVEYGYGEVGNTWLIPVPPSAHFYVSFPGSVTSAWFDSAVGPNSPSLIPPSAINYPSDINYNYSLARDYKNSAESYKDDCLGYSDYSDANEYAEYAEEQAGYAEDCATDSETKNAQLISYGITNMTSKTEDTRAYATEARGYATEARTYANSLPH